MSEFGLTARSKEIEAKANKAYTVFATMRNCTRACVRVRARVWAHARTHTCTCVHVCSYACARSRVHMHVCALRAYACRVL